jgi:hypothetical protein
MDFADWVVTISTSLGVVLLALASIAAIWG